ncbi:ricin-type beta-trefoil lectin domain protein [Streptomyces sp. HC307]|uniref:ricin-type beta-trefoil lectin domain protein n=1 Tax=Streptomyces flavusporus TaxID=3385496 RepID=UPI003916E430
MTRVRLRYGAGGAGSAEGRARPGSRDHVSAHTATERGVGQRTGQPEKWTLAADGSIRNVPAGLCLDVDGAATANRSALILWTCNGQDNRRWACG